MPVNNISMLTEQYAKREAAHAELDRLTKAKQLSPYRERELLGAFDNADRAIREAIRSDANAEISEAAAARAAMGAAWSAVEPSTRTRADVRVFGVPLAEMRDGDYAAAALDNTPIPAVLNAAGRGSRLLQRVNAVPFAKARGYIAQAEPMTAEVVARDAVSDFTKYVVKGQIATVVKIVGSASIDKDTLIPTGGSN